MPCICCSEEEAVDDLPQDTRHVGGRVRTRYFPVTTHLLHYPVLPGTLKIPITAKSFWVQCPTFVTPLSPGLTWAPKHTECKFGFPWHQTHGVSRNNIQFPKHPLSVQPVNLLLTWNWGSWYRLCMLRTNSVLSSDASHVVLSHSRFDKMAKTGKFQLLNLHVQ